MKYVPVWRQAEPYQHSRADHLRDVRDILAGVAVLGSLLLGLPFLLFLAGAPS